MFPHHQQGPGSLPTHWQPPTAQQPANGAYAHTAGHPPPLQHHPDPHQPPHAAYPRLPGPNEWPQPPAADAYRGQHPQQYMAQHHQPPAPRQRTAIACRYCRRRKIRCSGFEATDDGRCSNCMRFNQDCIFTPVSAQTQAFVPAHTVWRGVGQPPPMYGAYGQPLPPATSHADPYGSSRQAPQYLPSPTGAAPAPSNASYPSAPPNGQQQPYYAAPARRASPPSPYAYEPSRTSSSPQTQPPTTPGASSHYPPPPQPNGALQPPPTRATDGTTPPPGTNRTGMRINDLVSDNGAGRSSTDSNMLSMLNRRPM